MSDVVRAEIVVQLHVSGRQAVALDRSRAPVRKGDLRDALSYSVSPKQLRLKVGLIGKAINRKLFYGLFVEEGRKAGGRGITRGSAKYAQGIGAMAPRHFVFVPGERELIYQPLRDIWLRVLAKAASGVSDD